MTLRPPQTQHIRPDRQQEPQQYQPPQLHPEQKGDQLQHPDKQHHQAHHHRQHQHILPDRQVYHQQAEPHRQRQLPVPDRERQPPGQHHFPARGQHQHPQQGQRDASAEPFPLPPEVYSPRGPIRQQTTPRYRDDIHQEASGWAPASHPYDMEARHDHWNAPVQGKPALLPP